jgi:hypothetical protein
MALTLVDRAYHQECVVPIDINVGMQAVLDSTNAIRQAMRLVHVNARAAALDRDRAREAMLYAKLFALSSKSANGGLMIHALSAAAYERRALERLRGIVGHLSAEEKRDVLAILEPVGRGPTDTEPILERERALSTAKLGPLRTWILWVTSRSSDAAVQRFIENDAAIVKLNDEVLKLLGQ